MQEHGANLGEADFDRICQACRVPLTELETRGLVRVDREALEAVRAVKQLGLRLAICSNTPWTGAADCIHEWREFGLGDCFDAYVTSFEVGFCKPHPAMFQRALALLGVGTEAAAMIGDDLAGDVAGAAALGLRTIWKRNAERPADPLTHRPDAEIGHLGELPDLLRAWL